MAIAQLVLQYIQVIIWPFIILLAMLVFRSQLSRLIERITHARVPGGTELDFEVQQATERAAIEPLKELISESEEGEESEIRERIKEDPGLGLAELRIRLEQVLRSLYELKRTPPAGVRRPAGLNQLIKELEKRGDLPHNIAAHLNDVIPLANRASHGESVSQQTAERLGELGIRLLQELKWIYGMRVSEPSRKWEISAEARDQLADAEYKVTTVTPLVEKPTVSEYILTQEGIDTYLEGYEEYAEFIVAVEPLDATIPRPPAEA